MAEERERGQATEEPTPRRLEEARRRGQVAFSRELAGAAAFTAAFLAITVAGQGWMARLHAYLTWELRQAGGSGGGGLAALGRGLDALLPLLVLPLGAAFLAALGVGLVQTRGLLTFQTVRPELGRLSPAAYARRVLGPAALGEIGRGLVKLVLALAVASATLWPLRRDVANLAGRPAAAEMQAFGGLARQLGLRLALLMIVLGVVDYLLALRRIRRSLRMTRDEVRRDHRESEGDPERRAERQRLHRELGEQRMLADVRKADFVVVNPDHIAVAVRYEQGGERAPTVVAKGERLLAERIKEVAREAGVPVFQDVTLARALHQLEEGDEIPEALYEAVAELLRVVYGMQTSAPHQSDGRPAAREENRTLGARFRDDATWKRA